MHTKLHHLVQKTQRATLFFSAFLQAPFRVGSICSSGNALVTALTQQSNQTDGLIIDLGAGSGAVSNKLINAGIAPDRILAIEVSPHLAKVFRKRCPTVPLSIGDARNLDAIIEKHAPEKPIAMIISSLPFRGMPKKLTEQITATLQNVMVLHDCSLVQYSYALWMKYPLKKYGLCPSASKIIIKNFPPARVEWYRRGRS